MNEEMNASAGNVKIAGSRQLGIHLKRILLAIAGPHDPGHITRFSEANNGQYVNVTAQSTHVTSGIIKMCCWIFLQRGQ